MKVGDYVRTRWGCIAKFEGTNEGFYEFDNIIIDESSAVREELFIDIVEKTSPNIIDLIEVGDYVNGLKVSNVGGTYHGRKDKAIYCDYCEDKETGKWTMIYDDEIKSIVTKEQFKNIEYEVK